jgi:c-di-GMP-binding flagellar brake protein YcgR
MWFDVHSPLEASNAGASVRRYARALFSVPITLHHLSGGGIRTTRGISLDISEGGLGAIVQGGLHVGETVAIDLRLNECPLTTVGIVRHTSEVRCGFEFLGLTAEERLQITNVIGNA